MRDTLKLAFHGVLFAAFMALNGLAASPPDALSDVERTTALSALLRPENQLLEKARIANGDLYLALKSFVCREEIARFQGDLRGRKTHSIDHVSANLSFENGVERYSNIMQDARSLAALSALTGAWSQGEFGTLLTQTRNLLETQSVVFVSFSRLAGNPIAIYRFSVPKAQSPWDLEVAFQHYKIPFTTDLWVSAESGEILKIARKSSGMPIDTRISEIAWDVTLQTVELNGKNWLLPTEASYSVTYAESKRREWNQMSFSGYRRYGSESSLKFAY